MIMKKYIDEEFVLELCDFSNAYRMDKLDTFFHVFDKECNGNYIFEARKFGVKEFDEKKFLEVMRKKDMKMDIHKLIEVMKTFYPLNYVRSMGL